MAYRYGDRAQMSLFPASIEDYVPKDAPVRAYDVMVAALDMDELGIECLERWAIPLTIPGPC